jgi:hypothetical protein
VSFYKAEKLHTRDGNNFTLEAQRRKEEREEDFDLLLCALAVFLFLAPLRLCVILFVPLSHASV